MGKVLHMPFRLRNPSLRLPGGSEGFSVQALGEFRVIKPRATTLLLNDFHTRRTWGVENWTRNTGIVGVTLP